jgi:hypothetical protein
MKLLMLQELPYYMLLMFYPITDSHHVSYQTKTLTSCNHHSGIMLHPIHPTQHEHCLSPSNRWSMQMFQSETRTIYSDLHELPSDQLAPSATPCPICLQCLAQCHYKEGTLQINHGSHTPCPSNFQNHHVPTPK